MAKPKSQPRKPKESLIPEAEIPRPKLSEDELMALFYAGKVRPGATTTELQETYQALTTGSPHSASFVKEPKPEPPPQGKHPSPEKPFSGEPSRGEPPSPQEPFLREPSLKKPFLEEPFLREPSLQEGLPSCQEVPPEQFGEVLQQAFDLLPSLKPFEQLFYIWFLKLSYGIGRNYCRVRMGLLQRATKLSEKVVRETIRALIGKRCLTLLDGGSAGRASLYHVAKPKDALSLMKGSPEKPFSQEPSPEKGSHEIPALGNLSAGITRVTGKRRLSNAKPLKLKDFVFYRLTFRNPLVSTTYELFQ